MPSRYTTPALTFLAATAAFLAPARAEDIVWTCPIVGAETQYATIIFDPKLFGIDSRMDDAGPNYEMEFTVYAEISEYDESKPGWQWPVVCDFVTSWQHELVIPNVLYEFNTYPVPERIVIHNVPRHSIATITFQAREDDDFTDEYADFLAYPDGFNEVSLRVLVNALKAQSMTGEREGEFDITFGRDKRLVGDGRAEIALPEFFRALLEFNLSLEFAQPLSPNLPSPGQALNPVATNEPACRDYALNAVAMNVEAQKLGCGFAPPVWSNDHQMHFSWCMQGANAASAGPETKKRAAELDGCRAVQPNNQPPAPPPSPTPGFDLCGAYANEAVKAAVRADALGCGFSGPRWLQDFKAHYDFCATNPLPPLVLAEQVLRDTQLQNCMAAKGN
ncbi:MAG: hypothetical protein Q8Q26_16535 [Pseudorhodobacter sp.]|nr:hypothetical protein [Pseudorhodobacter sp.]